MIVLIRIINVNTHQRTPNKNLENSAGPLKQRELGLVKVHGINGVTLYSGRFVDAKHEG